MTEAGGSAARNKILIDPHAPKFLVSIPGAPSRLFWAGVHSFLSIISLFAADCINTL